jgi:hypothetical protein
MSEIHTHENLAGFVQSVIDPYGAEIVDHKYESTHYEGRITVRMGLNAQSFRYGLPELKSEIKTLALSVIENPERWKANYRREY